MRDHILAHRAKMLRKAYERKERYEWPSRNGIVVRIVSKANINRHTGRPHEHKREIARRLRQQEA